MSQISSRQCVLNVLKSAPADTKQISRALSATLGTTRSLIRRIQNAGLIKIKTESVGFQCTVYEIVENPPVRLSFNAKRDNKVVEMLKVKNTSTRDVMRTFGCSATSARSIMQRLCVNGRAVIVSPYTQKTSTVFKLGDGKPNVVRFLHPITIDNKPVRNGFETWLAGLMREAA